MISWLKKWFWMTIVMALIPSVVVAYTVYLEDGSEIKEEDLKSDPEITEVQYGLSSVRMIPQPVEALRIDRPVPLSEGPAETSFLDTLFPVDIAEASHEPREDVIQAFINSQEAVKKAVRLKEIEPYIEQNSYDFLKNKVISGVNEITMLMMMKELFPESPRIYDLYVNGDEAKVYAGGKSAMGDLKGIAEMVRQDGSWRLKQTRWVGKSAEDIANINPMHIVKSADKTRIDMPNYAYTWGFSKYYIDRNYLSLVHVKNRFPKDRFVFLFFWEKGHKVNQKKLSELKLKEGVKPSKLHILWTGPRQLLSGQHVYQDQYPVDVSIAPEKAGYMSGNLNLRLPKKRPKGVYAAVWLRF